MTSSSLRTVVLATDGSPDAELARWAVADLGVACDATVHVVCAWHLSLVAYGSPGFTLSADFLSRYEVQARAVAERERRALAAAGVRDATDHVVRGRPADVIATVADEVGADLVVVGSRGHGPLPRLALGSVSEAVVRRARWPVLVVRGGRASWPPRRLVAGHDGSVEAIAAAELSATVAGCVGAPLLLLEVVPALSEREIGCDPVGLDGVIAGRHAQLERLAHRLAGRHGAVVEARAITGDPASVLLGAGGEEASSLIAVGRRGIAQVEYALLGSVSMKLLHLADGPVLVVPHQAATSR